MEAARSRWIRVSSDPAYAEVEGDSPADYADVTSDLYARVYKVSVLGTGSETGRKETGRKKEALWIHKREQSKLRFFWSGDTQKREWVSYSPMFEETDFDYNFEDEDT